MKILNIKFNILIMLFFLFVLEANAQDFTSAQEALTALNKMSECKCDTDVKAYRYFTNHKDESIPLLINFTLNNRQRHHVSIRALSKIKDERIIKFLINLVSEEFSKNSNFAENQYYYSEGLISNVIYTLGNYGDKRAIFVIKKSLNRLNDTHRDVDEEALCKLGGITISDLFAKRSYSSDEMMKIASQNRYANPKFAIKLYDWITKKFPENVEFQYQSHFGKAIARNNLGEYKLVLKELDSIKDKFPSRIEKIDFAVDHQGYNYYQFLNFINDKISNQKD